MNTSMNGTVIITGPTGGLGKALALDMAKRPEASRPDLLLIGRKGEKLADILKSVRDAGATAYEVPCDFSRLSDVRAAADAIKTILASWEGTSSACARCKCRSHVDGYEDDIW